MQAECLNARVCNHEHTVRTQLGDQCRDRGRGLLSVDNPAINIQIERVHATVPPVGRLASMCAARLAAPYFEAHHL